MRSNRLIMVQCRAWMTAAFMVLACALPAQTVNLNGCIGGAASYCSYSYDTYGQTVQVISRPTGSTATTVDNCTTVNFTVTGTYTIRVTSWSQYQIDCGGGGIEPFGIESQSLSPPIGGGTCYETYYSDYTYVYTVGATPGLPTSVNASYERCIGVTNFTVQPQGGGSSYRFYKLIGANYQIVHSGTTYTPPVSIAGTTQYAVSLVNAAGCESVKLPFTVVVQPLPAKPKLAPATNADMTATQVRLNALSPVGGITYRWINKETGQEVATGISAWITLPDNPTEFVLRATSTAGCSTDSDPIVIGKEVLGLPNNVTQLRSFDGNGNVISQSRAYFDLFGKQVQTQTKSFANNDIYATQTVYDAFGKAAVNTLSAPIAKSQFLYDHDYDKEFIGAYTYQNFDVAGKYGNPDPVAATSKLGKFYASATAPDPLAAATAYPLSHTEYMREPASRVKRAGGVGETFKVGSGKEPRSLAFPVLDELNHYSILRTRFIAGSPLVSLERKAVKTVVRDAHGTEAVSFADQAGNTIATALCGPEDGKTHFAIPVSTVLAPGEWIEFHLPKGYTNFVVTGGTAELFFLETETAASVSAVAAGGSPLPGFYRIRNTHATQSLTLSYKGIYHDFTYHFYDDANRLKVTIPPLKSSLGLDQVPIDIIRSAVTNNLFTPGNNGTLESNGDGFFGFGARTTIAARTGNASIEIGVYNEDPEVFATVSVTPNKTYEISAYFMKPSVVSPVSASIDVNGSSAGINLQPGWNKVKLQFNSGSNSSVTIRFAFSANTGGYGFLDDVTLTELAPEPVLPNLSSYNYIPNTFNYNSLGWLLSESSPDGGTTNFVYRRDGKIRFSQSALQKTDTKNPNRFSYTLYDKIGRITEVGEFVPTAGNAQFQDHTAETAALPSKSILRWLEFGLQQDSLPTPGRRTQTFYRYDRPVTTTDSLWNNLPTGYKQTFVIGRLSKSWNANAATYYSYDEEGRVDWQAKYLFGLPAGQRLKLVKYFYDFLGRVDSVVFQPHKPAEYFSTHNRYDADGRISKVYTRSHPSQQLVLHTKNIYSLRGELKRLELGGNDAGTEPITQGIDYIYTLQGWLKSINHPSLDPSKDPGQDGHNNTRPVDAFGMTLDYFDGDYNRPGVPVQSITGTPQGSKNLYTGNIKAWHWRTRRPDSTQMQLPGYEYWNLPTNTTLRNQQQAYVFNYDKRDQLTNAWFGTFDGTTFAKSLDNRFDEHGLTYDANGNIQTLKRNAHTTSVYPTNPPVIDNLTYRYYNNTNKLKQIVDAAGSPLSGAWKDLKTQSDTNNYKYDALGQLREDIAENIKISYNVAGLVDSVWERSTSKLKMTVLYDENGQRICKISYDANGVETKRTWYLMGMIYEQVSGVVTQREIPIPNGVYYRVPNKYYYSLSDHLGNVRAVVERATTTPKYFADYYPFGWKQPGRSYNDVVLNYRYGYQGQENDKETSWDAFELRMWDGRIARWMTIDPKKQYASPYLGMGNNPLKLVDPDGGSTDDIIFLNNNKQEIGRIIMPGKDVFVDVPVNWKPDFAFKFELDNSIKFDAVGFGIEGGITLGGGFDTGFEFVYFINGKDAGGLFGYYKLGPAIGVEPGAVSGYAFVANVMNQQEISAESWKGWFSGYSGSVADDGLGMFWSSNSGKPELSYDSKDLYWKGYSHSFGVAYSPVNAKWSPSYYWLLGRLN